MTIEHRVHAVRCAYFVHRLLPLSLLEHSIQRELDLLCLHLPLIRSREESDGPLRGASVKRPEPSEHRDLFALAWWIFEIAT